MQASHTSIVAYQERLYGLPATNPRTRAGAETARSDTYDLTRAPLPPPAATAAASAGPWNDGRAACLLERRGVHSPSQQRQSYQRGGTAGDRGFDVPHKMMAMQRAGIAADAGGRRPVMLAIAGDSAAGKTTLTRGLVQSLGPERVTAVCVDDYHRYDREERRSLCFTPLSPECNYMAIMDQHLQLLATGQPILKPTYSHATGTFGRPELIEPRDFVIIEGLLPLYSRLARACFDVSVYLDPPEDIRTQWKIRRDCTKRGYVRDQVIAELQRRASDSATFIRPQRAHADIVVRFEPLEGASQDGPLSATLLLRPTITHPDLSAVLGDDARRAVHLKLARDLDGKPVDALHIHGHAPPELSRRIAVHIWESLGIADAFPDSLGMLEPGVRSEPLALAELILLYHMLQAEASPATVERPDGAELAAEVAPH